MSDVITFRVNGIPRPKGSTRGFVVTNRVTGRAQAIITNDNPKTKPWAAQIAAVAHGHRPAAGPWNGAVILSVGFYLPRPKSLPKSVVHHTKKPDLDKLLRALKDALKGIIYRDDAQVVQVDDLRKLYATHGMEPGVIVTIRQVGT